MTGRQIAAITAVTLISAAVLTTGVLAAGPLPVQTASEPKVIETDYPGSVDGQFRRGGAVGMPTEADAPDRPVSFAPDVFEQIDGYIRKNLGSKTYAGIYVEPGESGSDAIILSFTEDLSGAQQTAIGDLAGDSEVRFRKVSYSMTELHEKQREIEAHYSQLEKAGVHVVTVGADVKANRVEVGILPYSEEAVRQIHDKFGADMIHVVAGSEVVPMVELDAVEPGVADDRISDADLSAEVQTATARKDANRSSEGQPGILRRILSVLGPWLSRLFGV